jgi:hypothetical protein
MFCNSEVHEAPEAEEGNIIVINVALLITLKRNL